MTSIFTNPSRDAWEALCERPSARNQEVRERVEAILEKVRTRGDEALMELAREISAAVLAGRPVGLRCAEEFVPEGMIPPELSPLEKNALPYKADEMLERPILGINISLNERARYFEKTLDPAFFLCLYCTKNVQKLFGGS